MLQINHILLHENSIIDGILISGNENQREIQVNRNKSKNSTKGQERGSLIKDFPGIIKMGKIFCHTTLLNNRQNNYRNSGNKIIHRICFTFVKQKGMNIMIYICVLFFL